MVPDVEGAPCLGGHNRTAGPDGAPPAPIPSVKMVDPELGISSDAVRRKYEPLAPSSAVSCEGIPCRPWQPCACMLQVKQTVSSASDTVLSMLMPQKGFRRRFAVLE